MADTLTPQQWIHRLERLQRSFRGVQAKVREGKSRGEIYGSDNVKRRWKYKKEVEGIEEKIRYLDEALFRMEEDSMSFEITSGELTRRRGLLNRLKNEVALSSNILAYGRSPPTGDMDFAPQVEETLETRHLTNQQLVIRHQDEELKQESQLDEILQGVSTLKDIGYEINTELSFQGEILDGLNLGSTKQIQIFNEIFTKFNTSQLSRRAVGQCS
eukprot:CAMPEP_0114511768 /NCGR_PEP_ID=MMETSP0109-20121206/14594_1 /TAXON_ID=29199 /ORGANISM="Chlorarachnion reptans, Strain CCCM449" /LENGTH=214 /DNA_ID=CAMNT_0001691359 /DNA_START=128 /DNA_END=773 /DNA_ORIENTATION=+